SPIASPIASSPPKDQPTEPPRARKPGSTMPPPLPTTPPFATGAQPDRDSVLALPPPPIGAQPLLDAISPSPAATRRPPPPLELRAPDQAARRASDVSPSGAGDRPPGDDDFNTVVGAPIELDDPRLAAPSPLVSSASAPSPAPLVTKSGVTPPPTRIQRGDALADRPFSPPKVHPVPEIGEPGLLNAAKYALHFGRARYQRRGAIKMLAVEIKQDTEALDQVLGALGRAARTAKIEGRVFSAENAAIATAEDRITTLNTELADVDARKTDENSKFVDVESERTAKLVEAERLLAEVQGELAHLEGVRRGLRESRKDLERRQKAYLKAAADADRQSSAAQMGDTRADLRRSAEQHRRDAGALDPDRQEIDRKLSTLDRPIGEAATKVEAAKAELDAAKRSLADAREGHTHRLAELDAEQKRKAREIMAAESEITRRLVTLGTLVNLNRGVASATAAAMLDERGGEFLELYERIDRLRGAITARTTETEKLTAEREAYDRGTLVRGVSVIGGAILAFIAFIVILRAIIF
ncbi:MAG: hypothetical protein NT062_34295, partial [Proteobacteria bacterium]|nr:hypothetical protein [Pseudomonadota bacterium]